MFRNNLTNTDGRIPLLNKEKVHENFCSQMRNQFHDLQVRPTFRYFTLGHLNNLCCRHSWWRYTSCRCHGSLDAVGCHFRVTDVSLRTSKTKYFRTKWRLNRETNKKEETMIKVKKEMNKQRIHYLTELPVLEKYSLCSVCQEERFKFWSEELALKV